MAMSKCRTIGLPNHRIAEPSDCRTIGLPNHRIAEPFRFCFAEENNIPKNTDTNLEPNALERLF